MRRRFRQRIRRRTRTRPCNPPSGPSIPRASRNKSPASRALHICRARPRSDGSGTGGNHRSDIWSEKRDGPVLATAIDGHMLVGLDGFEGVSNCPISTARPAGGAIQRFTGVDIAVRRYMTSFCFFRAGGCCSRCHIDVPVGHRRRGITLPRHSVDNPKFLKRLLAQMFAQRRRAGTMRQIISYLRVSTGKQGKSGLGIEATRSHRPVCRRGGLRGGR